MKRDTERKITVEDLLRFKRAERPPAEFWVKFESEIRAKQLAAIVSRRPWWVGASRIFPLVYRHQAFIGMAAAVTLTWAGVHYMGGSGDIVKGAPASSPGPAPTFAAAVPAHFEEAVVPATVSQTTREEIVSPAAEAETVQRLVAVSSPSHVTQAPSAPRDAGARISFGDGTSITLADFHEAPPEASRRDVFGSDREFEASVAPLNQPVSEPLARMDPSEERRARLLAPALPAYSSGAAHAPASDWMRSRSSNDRMYESMDPYGSNDRAMVGFRF